jgi:hypothetical protein
MRSFTAVQDDPENFMKKFGSSIERVEGIKDQKEKEKVFKFMERRFWEQKPKDIIEMAREKTPEEKEIVRIINEVTNNLRENYGLENFNVPLKNIHVIEDKNWEQLTQAEGRSVGFFRMSEQAIMIKEEISRLVFLEKVLHEMVHIKSYQAQQVVGRNDEKDMVIDDYRVGLMCKTREGEKWYLTNLNEAVTEEVTKKLFKEAIAKDPSLFNLEIYETEKTKKKLPEYSDDENYWLFLYQEAGKWRGFAYIEQRKNLNLLLDKLFAKNSDKFKSRDEVFDIFAKAMLDGNIMPLGRLLEKSFARPGRKLILRQLAELDSDIEKQREFIESL